MSDQIADRQAKLDKICALGVDPYGGRFTRVTPNAEIRAAGERLPIDAGQILDAPEARFRAAGRVVLHRDIGSLIFMTVRDWTGEVQFGLSKKMVQGLAEAVSHSAAAVASAPCGQRGEPVNAEGNAQEQCEGSAGAAWKLAKLLDLGDIVGAEGRLGRTKTGELTLWVDRFTLLSKAVRPPPEKWHGLTDVEVRYRRRYVDLAASPESQRIFLLRARIIDYIRGVLRRRGFIEVDTPVLQPIYGGAAARPFTTHHNTLDLDLYLRISPELYLKRCLVGGLERVYEFARCFRNEGISPRHNPEFTMLELYQAYGDYHDMMDITEEIIAGAAREVIGSYRIATQARSRAGTEAPRHEGTKEGDATSATALEQCSADAAAPAGQVIDLTPPWPRRPYAALFAEYVGLAIDDVRAIRERAAELHRRKLVTLDPAKVDDAVVVNTLFEHYVEPHLVNPTFVIDYPAPLCPLTKRSPTDARVALRFECFANCMEMGNAYSELNDPAVQRETFSRQLAGEGDETMAVMDEDYCEALECAMPPAGGLGIGIDRLVMLLTGSPSIRDVLLFPLQRPAGL